MHGSMNIKFKEQNSSQIQATFCYNRPVSSFQTLQHLLQQPLQRQLEPSSATMKTEVVHVAAPRNCASIFVLHQRHFPQIGIQTF
jgi:hypothetical protein